MLASLQELLRSFNVSKKDAAKPRFEVLCRYSTREDGHSYKECIFNLSGEHVTVVCVRATQGYSSGITAELLLDSRTKVNTDYERTTQKRIPVYLLGDAATGTEGLDCVERAVSAKIELGMPGGVPKNFPDVIAHDTENMHRESILKYGLKPEGLVVKQEMNQFYALPAHLFEERHGKFAEWRNRNSHDGVAGKRSLCDCVIYWSSLALLQNGVHFHRTPTGALVTPVDCSSTCILAIRIWSTGELAYRNLELIDLMPEKYKMWLGGPKADFTEDSDGFPSTTCSRCCVWLRSLSRGTS